MNQTKKRLSIIKLAISITDIETIQLQVLKLAPIKTDSKIQEILKLLQANNYAQAQGLITTYIETAPDEIQQRTSQKDEPTLSEDDQAIIDEFNLFVTPTNDTTQQTLEIDINNFASIEPKITKEKHTIDFDSLLNIDADDVLPNNIDIDLSYASQANQEKDNFFEEAPEIDIKPFLDEEHITKDTFFEDMIEETTEEEAIVNHIEVKSSKEVFTATQAHNEEEQDIFNTPISEETIKSSSYVAMPHISEKFMSMKKRYPLIQKNYEKFETVESLLDKIATDGYTEEEIEEMISYIKKLIEKAKYTEAAQLLLVCGATESKFAQFMLARELYIGSVLTKNIPEAFTLMNTLAIDDYPEALCDLGQFYENGIGTTPDHMKAEGLYKEAVNLGIKRAKKHYTRLKKNNRGFFKG